MSNVAASAPLASISHTSVRWPARAARSARAAATDVLPTPPLPVTNSRWRSSRSPPAPGSAASAAEADAAVAVVGAHLDVGDLGRRHADLLPRLSVSHRTSTAPAEGRLDLLDSVSSRSSSGISTVSSRGAWVTPMRTSTATRSVRPSATERVRGGTDGCEEPAAVGRSTSVVAGIVGWSSLTPSRGDGAHWRDVATRRVVIVAYPACRCSTSPGPTRSSPGVGGRRPARRRRVRGRGRRRQPAARSPARAA